MLKSVWVTTNCEKFLKRWEYQNSLFASWETCRQIKKQQLEQDMEQQTGSKLGKDYVKDVFSVYAEYIMQNVRVDESQAGNKVSRRNINNLRYADDTTLTAES